MYHMLQFLILTFLHQAQNVRKFYLNAQPQKKSRVSRGENVIPSPSEEELKTFFDYLSQASKPVVLSYIPEYSDNYVQGYSDIPLPFHFFMTPAA